MLRERRIPPHPGAPFKLNHKLPSLEKMHMKIPEAELPFELRPNRDAKRRIFLNNFDASVSFFPGLIFLSQTQEIKCRRVAIHAL